MTDHAVDLRSEVRRPRNLLARLALAIRRRPLVWFFALTFAFSWWPA